MIDLLSLYSPGDGVRKLFVLCPIFSDDPSGDRFSLLADVIVIVCVPSLLTGDVEGDLDPRGDEMLITDLVWIFAGDVEPLEDDRLENPPDGIFEGDIPPTLGSFVGDGDVLEPRECKLRES